MGKRLDAALKRAEAAEKTLRQVTDDLWEREQIEHREATRKTVQQIEQGFIPVRALKDRVTASILTTGPFIDGSYWGPTRIEIDIEVTDPVSEAIVAVLR